MKNYKVEAWPWCADYCKKNQWNPHDSYFWDKAMLEYRRQHNIFEVGDDVVCDNFDETIKVINLYEGRLVIDTGIKTTPDSENTMVMALPAEMFRHATDEEIKAGKRL